VPTVDIYHVSTNIWTTTQLVEPITSEAAVVLGSSIFFAGGFSSQTTTDYASNAIYIYNTSSNSWTTAFLSDGRYGLGAAATGNYVIFGGGSSFINLYDSTIDIYKVLN